MIRNLSNITLISAIFLSFQGCNDSMFQPQGSDSLVFKTGVQGSCLNNLKSSALNTKAANCAELVSSKFDGDNLTVIVRQNAFCNSTFNLSSAVTNGKVMLKADDTNSTGSRCMCNYNLTYTFSGAKNTSYQIDYSGKVYNNDACLSSFEVKK